jgi:uncharacterized protein YggE
MSTFVSMQGATMNRIAHLVMLSLALWAPLAAAQPVSDARRTVSTSGQAVLYVTPDEVIIQAGVEISHADLDQAREELDARTKRLLDAVRAAGIDEKDLQTSSMQIYVRQPAEGREDQPSQYQVSRMYRVTVRDAARVSAVVDTVLKNGANRFAGITYRSTRLVELREQARKEAALAARVKATQLAEVLGGRLGRPLQISENDMPDFNPYDNFVAARAEAGSSDGSLPLGQVAVRANVSVTFELAD